MRKIFLTTIILLLAIYSSGQITDTITYNQKSKLNWTDFKEIEVVSDSSKGFNFSSSIQMRIVKVNVWTGVTTFEAYGIYYLSKNWISIVKKNNKMLEYFQLQFDIANSFAKQLEREINSKKINGAYKSKMEKIFKGFENRLNKIYQKMDTETLNGQNDELIETWKIKQKNGTLES